MVKSNYMKGYNEYCFTCIWAEVFYLRKKKYGFKVSAVRIKKQAACLLILNNFVIWMNDFIITYNINFILLTISGEQHY